VPPARLQVKDATRVADRQGPSPLPYRPGDDGLGGFVLGLPDPPEVAGLGLPLTAAVLAPPAGSALPGLGGPAGGGPAAALAVAQVLAEFGADRPPRHQQLLPAGSRDRVGVDDAQVHPRHQCRIRLQPFRVSGDGDLGGHVQVQAPGVVAEGDRPDLVLLTELTMPG
jgi:hypothetical protein